MKLVSQEMNSWSIQSDLFHCGPLTHLASLFFCTLMAVGHSSWHQGQEGKDQVNLQVLVHILFCRHNLRRLITVKPLAEFPSSSLSTVFKGTTASHVNNGILRRPESPFQEMVPIVMLQLENWEQQRKSWTLLQYNYHSSLKTRKLKLKEVKLIVSKPRD